MALINCPDCNTQVSDKAVQCPKCAYPISTLLKENEGVSAQNSGQSFIVNVQQPNLSELAIITNRKSEGLAFVLVTLFGFFGLLYANPKKVFAGFLITMIAAVFCIMVDAGNDFTQIYLVAGIICWFIFIVFALDGVKQHNEALMKAASKQVQIPPIKPLQFVENKSRTSEDIVNEHYFRKVATLKQLLTEQKQKVFGGSMSKQILNLLEDMCDTREDALYLLITYHNITGESLIENLKDLNSSYEAIRENVSIFIHFHIVEEQFPHNWKDVVN